MKLVFLYLFFAGPVFSLAVSPSSKLALQKAKYYMLKGDLKKSWAFIEETPPHLIGHRYRSLLHFIEGDYDKSLKEISSSKFSRYNFYPHICTLKIVNLMELKKEEQVKKEIPRCVRAIEPFSTERGYYLQGLQELSLGDLPEEASHIKMWLKKGLSLGEEREMEKLVHKIPYRGYRLKKVRELIAIVYYRLGKWEQASNFIKGIDSINSRNIRGNIKLNKGDHAGALKDFEDALAMGGDSFNAMEKVILLAYKLEKWEMGLKILQRKGFLGSGDKVLKTAFLLFSDKFKQALKEVGKAEREYSKRQDPLILNIMGTVASLRREDSLKLNYFATKACKGLDSISCWMLLQQLSWNELSSLAKEDKAILPPLSSVISGYKNSVSVTPLKERNVTVKN